MAGNDKRDQGNGLLEKHGELMTGESLRKALGYQSFRTFYRAVQENTAPVGVFKLPDRKGWFAKTSQVQEWLSSLP